MNFIRPEEFTKEELETIVKQLTEFSSSEASVNEIVQKIFTDFDKDNNGALDRKELRIFLNIFFLQYKIHFPVTDEYVDDVFVSIDANKDNKIQPEELKVYAMHFVGTLKKQYEDALATKPWLYTWLMIIIDIFCPIRISDKIL